MCGKGWRVCDTEGFSLLEIMAALALSSLVVAVTMQFVLSVWKMYVAEDRHVQYSAIALTMKRAWLQDIHGAVEEVAEPSELTLIMANRTEYRYYLNHRGQIIRVQSGGGTTVLAVGVKKLLISAQFGQVMCTVTFQNDSSTSFRGTSLSALGGG